METTREIIKCFGKSEEYNIEDERLVLIDRPELYAFEDELGKSIFEMTDDELIQMVRTFNRDRKYGENSYDKRLSLATLEQFAAMSKLLWDYYIDHVKPIRNPWGAKIKGKYLRETIIGANPTFTYDDIQKGINKMYRDSEADSYLPRYIESIIRLYYCGFRNRMEIIDLKEDMIDFENSTVSFPNKTVHLDSKTMELLKYTHNIESVIFPKYTERYSVVSYHGGYFKFIFMKGFEEDVMDDKMYFAQTLTILLSRFRTNYHVECNSSNIYYLGFYDHLVKNLGKEAIDDIIISVRQKEKNQILMKYAKEYGVDIDNSTQIKKQLRIYVG